MAPDRGPTPAEEPGTTAGRSGHPQVDEALAGLEAAADLPPAEQIAPLTEAHRTLGETLDSIGDV